jgi:hypothetical protein
MSEQARPPVDDRLGARQDRPRALSRVSELVEQAVAAFFGEGAEAEATASTVLEQLRERAEEAVVAIAKLEAGCRRRMYPRRWALTYLAARLEHDAALPFLRQAVLTPIPPAESPAPHSHSTVKEETVLRTAAVEGIAALAARGNDRARDSLLEFLSIESISIRRVSATSLLAMDEGMRDEVMERLPRQFHHLLDIRPIAVADAPQVRDPRVHLRDPERPEKEGAPDLGRGESGTDQPPPRVGK